MGGGCLRGGSSASSAPGGVSGSARSIPGFHVRDARGPGEHRPGHARDYDQQHEPVETADDQVDIDPCFASQTEFQAQPRV